VQKQVWHNWKVECENVPEHILSAQTFAVTFAGLVDNEGLAGSFFYANLCTWKLKISAGTRS